MKSVRGLQSQMSYRNR